MAERVVFYKLSQKYVDARHDVAAESRHIVYRTLALGHFLGVVDCLTALLEIGEPALTALIAKLPEGAGRRKLEGVSRWGEIEINIEHTEDVAAALEAGHGQMTPEEQEWADLLIQTLHDIQREPALYLIVRRRT